jgi:effector-binding domain-containing protein
MSQEVVWQNKQFIRETIPQFLHIPLPGVFGKTIARMWKMIEQAGAKPADSEFLMLVYDPSPWKSELYITVTKDVPEADNVTLSGTYMTKVFDGPFSEIRNWISQMQAYVSEKGKTVGKMYFYYTTCPKCAKKYGHNYVVVFAQSR